MLTATICISQRFCCWLYFMISSNTKASPHGHGSLKSKRQQCSCCKIGWLDASITRVSEEAFEAPAGRELDKLYCWRSTTTASRQFLLDLVTLADQLRCAELLNNDDNLRYFKFPLPVIIQTLLPIFSAFHRQNRAFIHHQTPSNASLRSNQRVVTFESRALMI